MYFLSNEAWFVKVRPLLLSNLTKQKVEVWPTRKYFEVGPFKKVRTPDQGDLTEDSADRVFEQARYFCPYCALNVCDSLVDVRHNFLYYYVFPGAQGFACGCHQHPMTRRLYRYGVAKTKTGCVNRHRARLGSCVTSGTLVLRDASAIYPVRPLCPWPTMLVRRSLFAYVCLQENCMPA